MDGKSALKMFMLRGKHNIPTIDKFTMYTIYRSDNSREYHLF